MNIFQKILYVLKYNFSYKNIRLRELHLKHIQNINDIRIKGIVDEIDYMRLFHGLDAWSKNSADRIIYHIDIGSIAYREPMNINKTHKIK